MEIDVRDKKRFLNWLVKYISFNQREAIWIINYLANHEAILTNVKFVEGAAYSPRGLSFHSSDLQGEAVFLTIQQQTFTDADQIFHEIRMNWKKELYVECLFPNSWQNSLYLAVLEDNPYYKWNENLDQESTVEVEDYFAEMELKAQIDLLYQQIDVALEKGDKEAFLELSSEVSRCLLEQKQGRRNKV